MIEVPRPPRALHAARQQRRTARLAAVQALYQLELGGGEPGTVGEEILSRRTADADDEAPDRPAAPALDVPWFRSLVEGAWNAHERLDPVISELLSDGWTLARCSAVLRAILRAGAYEIAERPEVPVKVAINEYVEVAHMFSSGGEPSLVNAVLDRLAARLRGTGARS